MSMKCGVGMLVGEV